QCRYNDGEKKELSYPRCHPRRVEDRQHIHNFIEYSDIFRSEKARNCTPMGIRLPAACLT
ncbi:MAG: hypothetical protein L0H37_05840, partial [Nitrosospira sp.]|nr:hypothetical protein [Nitrosospira sp.]